MKIKNINFNIFDRIRWETPFFVFNNDIDEMLLTLYDQIWNEKLDNFDSFIYEEENDDDMWSLDVDNLIQGENIDLDAIGSYNKTFEIYKKQAVESYCKKYAIESIQIHYVSMLDKNENKWISTQKALLDPSIKIIVDPVFLLDLGKMNIEYPFVSKFFIWDKINKKIVYLKYSMGVTKEYYYKSFYDYNLIKNLQIDVDDISVYLVDLDDKYNNSSIKSKVKFREQRAGLFAKSKANMGQTQKDKLNSYLKNSSLFLEKATEFGFSKNITFYNCANANFIYTKNPIFSNDEDGRVVIKYEGWDNEKNIIDIYPNFKLSALKLNEIARTIKEISPKDFFNFFINKRVNNLEDYAGMDYFGDKLQDKAYLIPQDLKIKIAKVLYGPHFRENSSKLYGAADKQFFLKYTQEIDKEYSKLPNFWRISTLNVIKNIHIKNSRTIWYDYEGFSSLIPILNGNFSYSQIVNQVSIIETINGKEVNRENLVIDTKNIKLMDLVRFIEKIYSNGADNFVVFNKTYENSRNTEIAQMVKNSFERARDYVENNQNFYKDLDAISDDVEFYNQFLKSGYKHWTDFEFLVKHINNKTIDLADCFKASSKLKDTHGYDFCIAFEILNNKVVKSNNINMLINSKIKDKLTNNVFLKQLHYSHSIKKIEHVITSNKLNLKTLIKPYKNLKIQKGTMAMDEAIKRYVGITEDKVWNYIEEKLKEYCENDVLAMIMVYELIMEIARTTNPEVDLLEYSLENTQSFYTLEENKIVVKS